MNITCAITDGMTPQDKEIYFAHMAKRHREEQEYLEARKQEMKAYKQSLIEDILKMERNHCSREQLEKCTTRVLEAMAY